MHFVTEEGGAFVNETGTYKMNQLRVEIRGTSWAGDCDLCAGLVQVVLMSCQIIQAWIVQISVREKPVQINVGFVTLKTTKIFQLIALEPGF